MSDNAKKVSKFRLVVAGLVVCEAVWARPRGGPARHRARADRRHPARRPGV